MKKKQKYLVPIYGLKTGLEESFALGKDILLRNINLINKEYEYFAKRGLNASYKVVLEINYSYDEKNPSEPYPGISLRIVNKFDAALVVYGNGAAGVAGILPANAKAEFGGITINSQKTHYKDGLDKNLDEGFADYYKSFEKAYDFRPMAFDIYRKSRGRFNNNDKAIDSCTVLESIFVPSGERSKKPFILNGLNIQGYGRDEICMIGDLVDYRNAIIHADIKKLHKLLVGSKYTHMWFENAFKLVRKILFKYVEKPWD